jgi:hypothetical protein
VPPLVQQHVADFEVSQVAWVLGVEPFPPWTFDRSPLLRLVAVLEGERAAEEGNPHYNLRLGESLLDPELDRVVHAEEQVEAVVVGAGVEIGVVVRHGVPLPVEIESLEIHEVYKTPQTLGVEPVLDPEPRRWDRDREQPPSRLEDLGEFLQEQIEVLLVAQLPSKLLRSRVLPVDVHPVEVVLLDQANRGPDELASSVGTRDHAAEAVGPVLAPLPHRNQHFELGVESLETRHRPVPPLDNIELVVIGDHVEGVGVDRRESVDHVGARVRIQILRTEGQRLLPIGRSGLDVAHHAVLLLPGVVHRLDNLRVSPSQKGVVPEETPPTCRVANQLLGHVIDPVRHRDVLLADQISEVLDRGVETDTWGVVVELVLIVVQLEVFDVVGFVRGRSLLDGVSQRYSDRVLDPTKKIIKGVEWGGGTYKSGTLSTAVRSGKDLVPY